MSPALRDQLSAAAISMVVRQVKYRLERDGGAAELNHLAHMSDDEVDLLVRRELAA